MKNLWDIWSIRGTVNMSGTGFNTGDWDFTHIYGLGQTETYSNVNESEIQRLVLDELQLDETGAERQIVAAGIEFAGSYVSYDAESILGLNEFVGEFFTVSDLNILRTFPYEPSTNGCDAFPITMNKDSRSVSDPAAGGANPFPSGFSYWAGQSSGADEPAYADFTGHTDNTVIGTDATPGDLFLIKEGAGSGGFGWLVWNKYGNSSAPRLSDSLAWPGNSKDYNTTVSGRSDWGPQEEALYGNDPVVGYIDSKFHDDSTMSVGGWVSGETGVINGANVRGALDPHLDNERVLRVILWSNSEGSGNDVIYQIESFILVRLIGYDLPGNNSWILAEYLGTDESCGQ